MNFFEDQRLAKQKTNQLIGVFIAVLISISVLTGILIALALGYATTYTTQYQARTLDWSRLYSSQSLYMISLVAGVVAFIILIITLFKTWELKKNPEKICEQMGALKVPATSNDFKLSQYRNIVEEMSIASSVPVPLIYILEDEAINAFACGYDINSAAICVTRGALDVFSRDELQAVVAHEYSHILNGDMSINLRLIGMLAGLLFLYYIGQYMLRSQRYSRRKEGNQAALIGLGLIILGLVGFLFGNFLKAAISRQREFLADASSVQFTRNPEGIVGALKKIAVHTQHGYVHSEKAQEAAHMFLVEGVKPSFFSLASHPDLYDRIKAVDKSFNKQRFLKTEYQDIQKKMQQERTKKEEDKSDSGVQQKTAKDKLQLLAPLLVLLQKGGNNINLGTHPEEELLRRFVANEDHEIQALSSLQKLEIMSMAFGQIKAMDKEKRDRLHRIVIDQINQDGKFDFDEFIIYSYLRPALEDVAIRPQALSDSKFAHNSNLILNLLWHMDKIELTASHKETLSQFFSFEILDDKNMGYTKVLNAFEKLRFSDAHHKQKLLKLCMELINFNGVQTQKEEVILKIIKQNLGVPGNEAVA